MKKKLERIRLQLIRHAAIVDLDGAEWKARMVAWMEVNKDLKKLQS